MHHRLWTFVNLILVVFSMVYIWIFSPHDNSIVVIAQLLAQIALILFLINVNMYFIFLVIRKSGVRQVKIRLAKISRHLMKWHIPIALIGTAMILGHVAINLNQIGPNIGYIHPKLLTGYTALAILALTLSAGWLRHKKASGLRRKLHLTSAMTLIGLLLIHMLVGW